MSLHSSTTPTSVRRASPPSLSLSLKAKFDNPKQQNETELRNCPNFSLSIPNHGGRRPRLRRRIVEIDTVLRGAALRQTAAGPAADVEGRLRPARRLRRRRRPYRRLLRRRGQRQVQLPDGIQHHHARVERRRVRRPHAAGGAPPRAGGDQVVHRLLAQDGCTVQPHFRAGKKKIIKKKN